MAVTPWMKKIPTKGPVVDARAKRVWPAPPAKKSPVAKKVVVPRKKKPAPNFRPEGWAMEGTQVTDKNRANFPSSAFEIVKGRNGTTWARRRTETTGIDPSYLGQIASFDDTTKRADSQIKTVYDALGRTLQGNAADATRRLGALVNLAGQDAGSFDAGAAAVPGGGMVSAAVNPGVGAIDQAQIDTGQTQAMRGAALAVNTANLDAQQSQGFGAQMRSQLASDRGKARTDYLTNLLFRSQDMAAAAREAQLQFLGDQADAETKLKIKQAELEQQAAIANMNEAGRNNRAALEASKPGANGGETPAQARARIERETTRQRSAIASALGSLQNYLVPQDNTNSLGTVQFKLRQGQTAPDTLPLDEFYRRQIAGGMSPASFLETIRAIGVTPAAISSNLLWKLLRSTVAPDEATKLLRTWTGRTNWTPSTGAGYGA